MASFNGFTVAQRFQRDVNKLNTLVTEYSATAGSVNDLRSMADTTTKIYIMAVEQGIPEGLARSFGSELSKYKVTYRMEKERSASAASDLLTLSSGFLRG